MRIEIDQEDRDLFKELEGALYEQDNAVQCADYLIREFGSRYFAKIRIRKMMHCAVENGQFSALKMMADAWAYIG